MSRYRKEGRSSPLVSSTLSTGALIILLIAIVSSVARLLWPIPSREGMEMWTFARNHVWMYEPLVASWSERAAEDPEVQPIQLSMISYQPMQRRLLSGFHSGTPMADLVEVERNMISHLFAGPLEGVGFVDLTERIREEGLLEQINAPSFEPWKKQGRNFGLPHDVHPVMLCYRADIIEAAGIDVREIETWDDFIRLLKPLQDLDGDGMADRYLLNLGANNLDLIEGLILQAGGQYFDERNRLVVNSGATHRVLATLATWMADGPRRITLEAEEFTAAGNQMKLEGRVLCYPAPDWLAGIWRKDLPGLAGKVKFMPMPAWTPGGCRTSVWGGTMLGIPRSTPDVEAAWGFAKYLYLSPDLARTLYRETLIISPVKKYWEEAWYDAPEAFYSGQPTGRLFIELAPTVPLRTNSQFNRGVQTRIRDVLLSLRDYAEAEQKYEVDELLPEARRLVGEVEELVSTQMERNVFVREAAE